MSDPKLGVNTDGYWYFLDEDPTCILNYAFFTSSETAIEAKKLYIKEYNEVIDEFNDNVDNYNELADKYNCLLDDYTDRLERLEGVIENLD